MKNTLSQTLMKLNLPERTLRLAVLPALFALFAGASAPAATTTGVWTKPTGDSWNLSGNWSGGVPGNAAGDVAYLTNAISAAVTITNDLASTILGSLTIGKQAAAYFAFTLTNNSSTSSGNALVFDNNGAGAILTFSPAGNTVANLVQTPITLQDNLTVNCLPTTINVANQLNGVISDSGGSYSITKSGPGVMRLGAVGTVNSYHGGTIIQSGSRLNAGAYNCFGFGAVSVQSGGGTFLIDATGAFTNAFNIAGTGASGDNSGGAIHLGAGTTLSGPVTLTANARIGMVNTAGGSTVSAALSGGYELELAGTVGTVMTITNAATANSTAATRISRSVATFSVVCASANALSTGPLTMNGGTLALNGYGFAVSNLSSAANSSVIQNGHSSTASTLTIGADNTTTTYGGTLVDGGTATLALTKVGAGTLTLSNANTYTGSTSVSNGTLRVDGSLAAGSAVYVAPAGNLRGYGVIGGTVTVDGTLSPGASIGTLTVNNTVKLNPGGTVFMEINPSVSPSNDVLSASAIVYGGTLTVASLGGTLAPGQSYQLFRSSTLSGNFAVTNLPALNPGLSWKWDPAAGTISVLGSVATNPTNITGSVSGGNFNLSWPADHIGWRLQVQTNNLGTNWSTWPGSDTTNLIVVPINPANAAVFFRQVYP